MAKWHFEHLRRGKGIRKRRPPAGTVFTWGWHDKTYYGIVLVSEASNTYRVFDSDFVCLFNIPHNTPGEDVPWDQFTAQNLQIPPVFVAKTCWTMGFFQEYAHKELTNGPHEFFHMSFFDGRKKDIINGDDTTTHPPYGVLSDITQSGMGVVEYMTTESLCVPSNYEGDPGPVTTTPVPSLLGKITQDHGEQLLRNWLNRNGTHIRTLFEQCFEPEPYELVSFCTIKPEKFTKHGLDLLVGCEILAASIGRPAWDTPAWLLDHLTENPFIIDNTLRAEAIYCTCAMYPNEGDEPDEGIKLLFPQDTFMELNTGLKYLQSRIMLGIDEHNPNP